jgi:hypothetical protein
MRNDGAAHASLSVISVASAIANPRASNINADMPRLSEILGAENEIDRRFLTT